MLRQAASLLADRGTVYASHWRSGYRNYCGDDANGQKRSVSDEIQLWYNSNRRRFSGDAVKHHESIATTIILAMASWSSSSSLLLQLLLWLSRPSPLASSLLRHTGHEGCGQCRVGTSGSVL